MALQKPLIIYPSLDVTVDATSTVTFYCDIRGTLCTKYAIYIYDVATSTLKYSSTQTLSSVLYDGDRLNINVNMATVGGADSYYWFVRLYWTSTDYTASDYKTFIASTPPTCIFAPNIPSTITTPSYTFISSYDQAEGIGVKYYQTNVYDGSYDGTTNPSAHLIGTSGVIEEYPNNIRYTFNGLVSRQSYKVQTVGMTQGGVEFATPLTSFDVAYIVPTTLANPNAVQNPDSSVSITWPNIVSIEGTTDGVVAYEPNFVYTGNYGLNMDTGAYVEFVVDFSPPFTAHWLVKSPTDFTGVFGVISDSAGMYYASLGYDGTRFYLDIDGNLFYDPNEALADNVYIVSIIHNGISIRIRHKEAVL